MVNKCSAYGCKSGYKIKDAAKNTDVAAKRLTFHSYPIHNQELCDKWVRANPRQNFTPSKHSKLCSLHFKLTDFVEQRQDSNKSRTKQKIAILGAKLCQRYLKNDAVPSIFKNAPEYCSSSSHHSPRQTVSATVSNRMAKEAARLQKREEAFLASDVIAHLSVNEIAERLKLETTAPTSYHVNIADGILLIYRLQLSDNVPVISSCIAIKDDLYITVSVDGKVMPVSQFRDICTERLERMSQLTNLMARVKQWDTVKESRSLEQLLTMAVSCFEEALENIEDSDEDDYRKISFLVEQTKLISKPKFSRHYSPQLTVMAYLIHASSRAAYNILLEENILCLPSVSTLNKVTKRLKGTSGLDNSTYLKMRVKKLNELERSVILMIDEIYIAKRVEYTAGEIQGLTADGTVASTLLCFMVKSLTSKYKDLVAIYPVNKLTASKQYECYKEVVTLIESVSLNVTAISVDNAAVNRKFFTDFLCDGTLKTSVLHPVTKQPIFLIFDPVHNLKNLYNNFQARKVFKCPPCGQNLLAECEANFQHVIDLYNMEECMSLKKAYRLSSATLQPKSIEKTSVKLALSVFCESTRDALSFYGTHEGKQSWNETANFIGLVIKLWNVLNVKSHIKGKHKRDYTMDPIRSSRDWKLQFLGEFADFLARWESRQKAGLTRETFLSLRHTCLALRDCASYLVDRAGFNYVLLGHLQSDAIERRFGWLRQLSGANYFISMRQVLEGDRKIRAVSLLKFSSISLAEIDSVNQSEQDTAHCDETDADDIATSLSYNQTPSANDANIIYYVSGAIARSVGRVTKCDHCKELLIASDEIETIELDESLSYNASTFLDTINRGGLSKPTEITFNIVMHSWRVYEEIRQSDGLKEKLLKSANQRSLFTKVMQQATVDGQLLVTNCYCNKGHDLGDLICRRFFNCVAKNLVKDMTTKANPVNKQLSQKRKIAKLSGQTNS